MRKFLESLVWSLSAAGYMALAVVLVVVLWMCGLLAGGGIKEIFPEEE